MIDNRPVGLWMLPAHASGNRSMLAAIQRDFARLRALEHPNIARLLELGCNGGQHYVTGERLDGESLREVLNHLLPEHPEVQEADDIVRAVGSALVYAHEREIAHGDVRAENVVITMDRRVVLTNFLARRVAKIAAQPPRPSDDLKGLARLAAELYTGSISARALRGAVHGDVPAARLNAIRAVLEATHRRPGSVAQFLATAGLGMPTPGPARPKAGAPKPHRSWSIWRLVLPMAAVAVVGSLVAAYHGGGVSAEELKVRGLDALRAVTARVAPGSTAGEEAVQQETATADADPNAPAPSGDVPDPAEIPAPVDPQPAAAVPAVPATQPSSEGAATAAVAAADEAPTVSLGVPYIAAREDHSVVAIEVIRSGDPSREAAVGWWTSPGTADAEDDYADLGVQTVTFSAGATVERVLIPLVNDGVREPAEVFTVRLGRLHGVAAGAVMATRVTLHDDD